MYRKTQNCQGNYAKQLNNYHTSQNEHSMRYIFNLIFSEELHVIQLLFSVTEITVYIK